MSTIRQIQEAVINIFNQQALPEAFHLYHTLRRKGLRSRAKTSDKIIKCIMEWMTEDESGTGIPHFVALKQFKTILFPQDMIKDIYI